VPGGDGADLLFLDWVNQNNDLSPADRAEVRAEFDRRKVAATVAAAEASVPPTGTGGCTPDPTDRETHEQQVTAERAAGQRAQPVPRRPAASGVRHPRGGRRLRRGETPTRCAPWRLDR